MHIPWFRQVLHDSCVARRESEDFLDAQRIVLGSEDVLHGASLDGLLLLAHYGLDKVYVDRFEGRKVQAAVDR